MQLPVIRRRPSSTSPGLHDSDLHPVLQHVYGNRGITRLEQLERNLSAILSPDLLDGMADAIPLLADCVEQDERILIIGDFDCDGATSSALAVLALRSMGCSSVDYLVPDRFTLGYGLTPEIVQLALRREPALILTVDNGISSIRGVEAANRAGVPVVITDHHLPGSVLPDAAAIVNPNVPGNSFPSKALAGVGVIFYLLLGLRSHLRERGWFEKQGSREPNMAEYLDLVALGTVADLVPLDENNRILVHQGLARIRAGRCRPGITALLNLAGRNVDSVTAADLGFAVAPRLNAAGRLDDMSRGIECLLANSDVAAKSIAGGLNELNLERRRIEEEMKQQALDDLAEWQPEDNGEIPWGLCLFEEGWHQGVIGILASRVKERYHRPVIVFAMGEQGELKGSARSIAGLHIRDALDEIAASNPGLLNKFGGHAMAAGLTLERSNLEDFRRVFDQVVRRHLEVSDFQSVIDSDGEISGEHMNLQLARLIQQSGPWGQGFPEPVFDGVFTVVSERILKQKHWKIVVRPQGHDRLLDAIGFNLAEIFPPPLPHRVRLAYQLDVNEFRGNTTLQLRVQHIERVQVDA